MTQSQSEEQRHSTSCGYSTGLIGFLVLLEQKKLKQHSIFFSLIHNDVGFFAVELSEKNIIYLAKQITSKMDLRELGAEVLKIPSSKIDAALEDNPSNIVEAAYNVLRNWRESKGTGKEAYTSILAGFLEVGWKKKAEELRQRVEGPNRGSTELQHQEQVIGTVPFIQQASGLGGSPVLDAQEEVK